MKTKNYVNITDPQKLKGLLSKVERKISKLQSRIFRANLRNDFMNDHEFWFTYLPIGMGVMLGLSMYLNAMFNLGVAITAGVFTFGTTVFSLIDTGLQSINVRTRDKLQKHAEILNNKVKGYEKQSIKDKEITNDKNQNQSQEKTLQQENVDLQKVSNLKKLNGKNLKKNANKEKTIEL